MRHRIFAARFLIRLGDFLQTLALMVMRPDDLVTFSRLVYCRPDALGYWAGADVIASGLEPQEEDLLGRIPLTSGRLILLGVGGGREAIALARRGFEVTGVDFVHEMVERAVANAAAQGVKISGVVQEMSRLNLPTNSIAVAWFSTALYSGIPTRIRRVDMLKTIWQALSPGGYVVCQFWWDPKASSPARGELLRKAFAFLTRGYLQYQRGDMLWRNAEFIHAFSSEDEISHEFQMAGFDLVHLSTDQGSMTQGAILQKNIGKVSCCPA